MTVADDLATLRDALDDYTAVLWCHGYVASDPTEPDETAYAALDRVEAEIARLRDGLREIVAHEDHISSGVDCRRKMIEQARALLAEDGAA